MSKKRVFIFSPEQKTLLKRRALRMVEHAFKANVPYLIATDSWSIFLQANEGSYWKALVFISRSWWHHVCYSDRVLRWRETFYHWRTGRDGAELWDKLLDDAPGTTRIQREEIKAIIEGREPSDRLQ